MMNENNRNNDKGEDEEEVDDGIISSQQEALNRMYKIVQQFTARTDSEPFREPVNWKELQLYDYPKVIKHMMDLGTIQKKIDDNKYKYAAEVAFDLRLIWNNCMTYNAEQSEFWFLAKQYSKRFEDRYRRIRNDCTYILNKIIKT